MTLPSESSMHSMAGTTALFLPFVLLYLSIPGLAGYGLEVPGNNLVMLGGCVAVGVGLVLIASRGQANFLKPLGLLLLSCLLFLPGIVLGHSVWPVSETMLRVLLLISYLFVIKQHFVNEQAIIFAIVLCGYTQALFGLGQFFGLPVGLAGVVHPEMVSGPSRILGSFGQPNAFASFLATSLAFLGYILLSPLGSDRFKQAVAFFIAALFSTALVLASSRVGWAGLVAAYLGVSLAMLVRRESNLFLCWSGSIFLGVLAAVGLVLMQASPLAGAVPTKMNLESPRWVVYGQAIRLIGENFWFGVGFGNWESAYVHSAAAAFHDGRSQSSPFSDYQDSHSIFLQWWAESGVFGFLGICLLLFWPLMRVIRSDRRFDGMTIAAVTTLAPVLLHATFEFPFKLSASHILIYATAVSLCTSQISKAEAVPIKGVLRAVFGFTGDAAILAGSLIFSSNGLNTFYLWRAAHTEPVETDQLAAIQRPMFISGMYDEWFHNIMYRQAVREQDYEQLKQYVVWAESAVEKTPQSWIFETLIRAYDILGMQQEKTAAEHRHQYFFPQRSE